jgi:hypothetical protein
VICLRCSCSAAHLRLALIFPDSRAARSASASARLTLALSLSLPLLLSVHRAVVQQSWICVRGSSLPDHTQHAQLCQPGGDQRGQVHPVGEWSPLISPHTLHRTSCVRLRRCACASVRVVTRFGVPLPHLDCRHLSTLPPCHHCAYHTSSTPLFVSPLLSANAPPRPAPSSFPVSVQVDEWEADTRKPLNKFFLWMNLKILLVVPCSHLRTPFATNLPYHHHRSTLFRKLLSSTIPCGHHHS